MKVAVAVIAWNGHQYLAQCLESLAAQTACPDVLVLDNASTDDTVGIAHSFVAKLEARSRTLRIIIQPSNLGYTRGANTAMRALLAADVAYDVIALLNQDATLD